MSLTLHPGGWRSHLQRMLAVARIETLRLLVDRASLGLILIVPAVQLVLFGYAVNLTPKNISVAIGKSCSNYGTFIRDAIADSGGFQLLPEDPHLSAASRYVVAGRALVGVDCAPGEGLLVTADASDPSVVRPAVAALESTLMASLLNTTHPAEIMRPTVRWLYNPGVKTVWSLAPGLIGVIVMITALLLGALTLVREREQGSWEGLLASPVTGLDALIGKLTPYVVVAVLQASVVIVLARFLFAVPLLGNVTALILASAVLALAHLTLGFALSALARSQTQAIQAAVFFYLPSMLLSGFMFPFQGMPTWAQKLGEVVPLTHFVRSARGVMLKGYDAQAVVAEMWPVAVFALGTALLALGVFRRQLR